MKLMEVIKNNFSLDYRSLALYRFCMGIIVMVDAIYRLPHLTDFYTDVGLVPRSLFVSEMAMPWSFSLHLANGSLLFAAIMFSLHILIGFFMMIGYKTRWATFAAFIFTVSVHNRNWLINNGGDDILRSILFISVFLPLNRFFSVDSALSKNARESGTAFFSMWTLAAYLQVFVIYFVSYLLKNHPIWRSQFLAIFYASRLDIFATGIGVWLRQFFVVQKLMTFFTIMLEFLGPVLLVGGWIFGKYSWIIRLFVVVSFISLHFGIILTMWIGVFPYICIVMWLMFLPGKFWDLLERRFSKRYSGFLSHLDHSFGAFKKIFPCLNVTSEMREVRWVRVVQECLGGVIVLTILMWNVGTIKRWNIKSEFFESVARYLHLYQEWNMFSPYPKMDNVWIEVPAILSDGSQIELITGDRDVYSVKSERFPEMITNEHWRKFYLNVSDSATNAKYYAGFLCRKWNDQKRGLIPETSLRKMEVIVYSQLNLPDGSRGGINKKLSWKHWCFDEDYKRELNK